MIRQCSSCGGFCGGGYTNKSGKYIFCKAVNPNFNLVHSCRNCKFFIDDCCDHLDVPDAYVPSYIQYSGCGLHLFKDLK
jgi:hypothetical protein